LAHTAQERFVIIVDASAPNPEVLFELSKEFSDRQLLLFVRNPTQQALEPPLRSFTNTTNIVIQ